VAQAIAGEIQVKLTPQEQARLAPRRAVNPESQEAYLKGIYWSDKFEWAKAMDYFLEATRKDPDYASAYAALSVVYGNMINAGLLSDKEGYPKWRAVVTRAMELDDSLAEAHVSLGVLGQYHDWNWTEGNREMRRAIQLNPNLALAHLGYGDGLCMTGRPDQRALQLDPYSVVANVQLGYELLFTKRPPHHLCVLLMIRDAGVPLFNLHEVRRNVLIVQIPRSFAEAPICDFGSAN